MGDQIRNRQNLMTDTHPTRTSQQLNHGPKHRPAATVVPYRGPCSTKHICIMYAAPSSVVEPPSKSLARPPRAKKAAGKTEQATAKQMLQNLIVEQPHLSLQFRVKAELIERKLTQRKLSKEVGVGGSSLSRWLNGLTAKMNNGHLMKMDET